MSKELKCRCGRIVAQYEWVDCEFEITCASCLNKRAKQREVTREALRKISEMEPNFSNVSGPDDLATAFAGCLDGCQGIARAALDRKQEEPCNCPSNGFCSKCMSKKFNNTAYCSGKPEEAVGRGGEK